MAHWNAKNAQDRLDAQVIVGLRRTTRDRLDRLSNARGIPRSALARRIIEKALERETLEVER